MLGALGVVFGDIGTSPLYAMRECFLEPDHHNPSTLIQVVSPDRVHVLGERGVGLRQHLGQDRCDDAA